MADKLDNSAPFNDDQGTRRAKDAQKPTGAGAEATEATDGTPNTSSHEHVSGYGGKGGTPKTPNDDAKGRR
jgi:hypothetical protein